MDELVYEYIKYLTKLDTISKPTMPIINPLAYSDNEYLLAIGEVMNDYSNIDDLSISLEFLKERSGS